MRTRVLVLTCEHAGNDVPDDFRHLFKNAEDILVSHRGWDPGALLVAERLANLLKIDLHSCDTTRLLIEPNRSLDSPQLFSEFTFNLSEQEKQGLIESYYLPYRQQIEQEITRLVDLGYQIIHLSIHSFTPIWKGVVREVEIGLLFDDDRQNELHFCQQMKDALEKFSEEIIRFNEPYLGKDDGFTTYLRNQFADESYLGIEIEINQKYGETHLMWISDCLIHALKNVL
jgi:predicted N-formylglutamate amidohydrolase